MIDHKSRLNKIRSKLVDIDGLIVAQPENRRYLTGFVGSSGYVIITRTSAVLATDFRYVEQARHQAAGYVISRIDGPIGEWFPSIVGQLGIKTLGFESGYFTVTDHHSFEEAVRVADLGIDLKPVDGIVENLRTIKDEIEIKAIEAAADLTERALAHVVECHLNPGISEKRIAWELEKYIREAGGELSFPIIVASGPSSAEPHAEPTDRQIRLHEPVVVDMGARLDGYCADLTRTFCLGDNNSEFRRLYDIVYHAQKIAIEGVFSGMTGFEADKLSRDIIENAGYGQNYGHGLGHGIGLEVHELPRLSARAQTQLLDNMTFTIEPGIYIPGWGGIRIEDDAVLECGKIRLLTNSPK